MVSCAHFGPRFPAGSWPTRFGNISSATKSAINSRELMAAWFYPLGLRLDVAGQRIAGGPGCVRPVKPECGHPGGLPTWPHTRSFWCRRSGSPIRIR